MRQPIRTTTMAVLSAVLALGGVAGVAAAQPTDPPTDEPADPWAPDAPDAGKPDQPAPATPAPETAPAAEPAAQPEPLTGEVGFQPPVRRPKKMIELPTMFNAPTGYFLPAGVIMTTLGVDTGGGASGEARIGLGDVAEFGFGTTDQISKSFCDGDVCDDREAIQPYALAQFRMGLTEDRLFRNQPALVLGFRKSFTREHDARKTRVAELYLVASKKLGESTRIHVGGDFWDAGVMRDGADREIVFHDKDVVRRLRAFGGIEVQPLPRLTLMLELYWSPLFRLRDATGQTDSITLRPTFSWGVRYQFADWGLFESGVRIPDIGEINLLEAQIFGQLRLVSTRFANFLDGVR